MSLKKLTDHTFFFKFKDLDNILSAKLQTWSAKLQTWQKQLKKRHYI